MEVESDVEADHFNNPFHHCPLYQEAMEDHGHFTCDYFYVSKSKLHGFHSRLNSVDLIEWLTMERFFDAMDVPKHKKVKIMVLKFRGYAAI